MFPPETVWGYDLVTSAYGEEPVKSWQRITNHVKELYPDSSEETISRLIGKSPANNI